jgi:predicted CXXCH cytochrome family protein
VQVGTPSTTANIHTACASCHGTASRAGLVVPGALATGCTGNTSCHGTGYATNNHNARTGNETVHIATGMTTAVGAYTYNNTCAACHSAGLSLAHTDTSTTANLISGNPGWNTTAQSSCRDCHNAAATSTTVASAGVIKANWATKTCDACHTTLHNSINNHSVAAASGCTLSTGCHGYTGSTLDVRAVHDKLNIGCTANGTDSKGWSGGCHKVDKAMTTTAMSCGTGATGQACHTGHTASNHMPAHDANDAESVNCTKSGCHEAGPTRSIATTSVISLHATDTIGVTVSGKTNNGCNICHGGNGWTDVHATAKANATGFQCVGCHNGTVVGTHTYTGRDGTSLHYTSNATTHTAAAAQSGINYTGGYACTQCHPLDMWAAHTGPTDVAFTTVPGTYADKCRACHESKVDSFTASTWNTKLCTACHTTAASHDMTATAHNATNAAIPDPSLAWTDAAPTGGFSDGFESNSFANWTSANLYLPSGSSVLVWDAGMENWTSLTAPTTPIATRAFTTVSSTTVWSLRTNQTNGALMNSGAYYTRFSSTTAQTNSAAQLTSGMDLSSYSSARVDWYDVAALFNAAGNTAKMEWTKDGGATWTTEWTITAVNEGTLGYNTWASHSVTIPSTKLSNNCGMRFVVTSTANATARTFYVDELHVYGVNAPVTGGWATTTTANPPSTYAAGACGTGPAWYYLTETGIGLTGADSATLSYAIKWNTLEAADGVVAQYTTDGGTTWTSAKTYAPSGVDPATQAWKVETLTGLPATTNGIRFGLYADSTTGDQLYIDDVSLSAAVSKPASTAGVSCMNNPNGTECHDVSDVAALHNNTVSKCTACHKNNTTLPVIECQTAGCHAGVNLSEHIQKGVGAPGHHENGGAFTSYAVANECAGCHDDSVANEHFVLTANTSKPCSVCHKTNYTVGTYSPAKATVTGQITAKAIACDGCHTTSTATSPHAQRMGTTTTLGSAQFQTNWSGHRVWSTMPGSKTTWTLAADGAAQTLALPTGAWLNSGWTTTSMVECSDCHGSITGSTGPHGAAMSVNIAAGYDNSYTLGTLQMVTAGMSNSTNLCAKCHTTALKYNSAHNDSNHYNVACTYCHTKVPHAWKRPRLIGYTTDPAPYQSTAVTGIQTTVVTATGWSKGNCSAPNVSACNTHATLTANLWP